MDESAGRGDLVSDTGKAYGLGLCLTKDLGDVANEDGITLVVTVTDGQREATIDVKISGATLTVLKDRDEDVEGFLGDGVYRIVSGIPFSADRYAGLVARHPVHLSI